MEIIPDNLPAKSRIKFLITNYITSSFIYQQNNSHVCNIFFIS